jgi:peptidoglycan/LPS O-acetylase OafA/YrhL
VELCGGPGAAGRPERDAFLDVVRGWSITRVIAVHLLAPLTAGSWLGWVAPGMPIVFFVAGALAFASLDPLRPDRLDPRAFRLHRLTRILVPYWALAVTIVTCAFVASVVRPSPSTAVQWWTLPEAAVPAVVPTWSESARFYTGHLWFASNIVVMVLLAPPLARAYRRWRWWPLTLTGAWSAVVVVLGELGHTPFREARALATYGVMFCAGFLYTDRSFRPPRWAGPALVAVALPLAVLSAHTVGGLPNTSAPVGLSVAACWLGLALMARGPIRRWGDRHRGFVGWVSARTLTIYLWGWPTSRLAIVMADQVAPRRSGPWAVVFLTSALGLLAAAVAVFFPVERRAADLARSIASSRRVTPAPARTR